MFKVLHWTIDANKEPLFLRVYTEVLPKRKRKEKKKKNCEMYVCVCVCVLCVCVCVCVCVWCVCSKKLLESVLNLIKLKSINFEGFGKIFVMWKDNSIFIFGWNILLRNVFWYAFQ